MQTINSGSVALKTQFLHSVRRLVFFLNIAVPRCVPQGVRANVSPLDKYMDFRPRDHLAFCYLQGSRARVRPPTKAASLLFVERLKSITLYATRVTPAGKVGAGCVSAHSPHSPHNTLPCETFRAGQGSGFTGLSLGRLAPAHRR
jgi:hypothetical protein